VCLSSIVRPSSVYCSSLRRPLYFQKYPTSGLSANQYILLFDLDESRRPTRQGFSSQLFFVLGATLLNTCPRTSASSITHHGHMIPYTPRTNAITYARTHVAIDNPYLLYYRYRRTRIRQMARPCIIQNSVVILARSAKVFHLKVKNPEIKTGLVPRLDLDEKLYAANAIVTNRGGKAYIKIANTLDTDRCIDALEVELEKIERIAHRTTKSKRRVKGIRFYAVNVVATDHVPSARFVPYTNFCVWITSTKRK